MQNFQNQILLYFSQFSDSIRSYAHNWNLPDLNTLTIVAIFVLLIVFLLGVTFGKSRLLIGILSLYIARLLEISFVYFDKLSGYFPSLPIVWLHLVLFVIFAMIIFLLLQRSTLGNHLSLANSSTLFVALLSILGLGLVTTLVLQYLPTETYQNIRPDLLRYFDTKTAQFWWAVAPVLALLFMRRRD